MAKTGGPNNYASQKAQILKANAWGREFEDTVKASCQWYRDRGIARLSKAQPPPRGTGATVGAGTAPVDFTGRLMNDREGGGQGAGTRIAFECKHITRTATWKFDENRMSQAYYLDRVRHHGGIAFVLFHDRTLGKYWLCPQVRTLALGRHIDVRSIVDGVVVSHLPEVPLLDAVVGGKAVKVLDFIPVSLKTCIP